MSNANVGYIVGPDRDAASGEKPPTHSTTESTISMPRRNKHAAHALASALDRTQTALHADSPEGLPGLLSGCTSTIDQVVSDARPARGADLSTLRAVANNVAGGVRAFYKSGTPRPVSAALRELDEALALP